MLLFQEQVQVELRIILYKGWNGFRNTSVQFRHVCELTLYEVTLGSQMRRRACGKVKWEHQMFEIPIQSARTSNQYELDACVFEVIKKECQCNIENANYIALF
jgi:hypothetical protein